MSWFGALVVACRPAATPDACAREDVLVRGACVSQAGAEKYCGPAARWDRSEGACVLRACDDGQLRDRTTGACVGARALRGIGERRHVLVDAEHVLGCGPGLELRVAADDARCMDPTLERDAPMVPRTSPGAPDTRACGRGQAWDGKGCATLVRGGRVDVAAWARATFGPAGATSPTFCARATADPSPFGLLTGASTTLDVSVELALPDNDVTAAYARVKPLPGGHSPPPAALARVVAAVEAEVELLRAIGGTAEVAGYTQALGCPVRAGAAPVAVPRPREAEER